MAALAGGMGIGRFVYTPILPEMVAGLGLSQGEAGLIGSANFLGYLAGALAAALRLPGSPRTWLLGGLAASMLTTAAMAVPSTVPALLALRFVGGVASAFVLVFASTLVLGGLAAAGRSGLATVFFAGVGVGITVSAVLVGLLGAADAGWRTLWWASGVTAALALAAAAMLTAGAEPHAHSPRAEGTGGIGRGLLPLVAAYGLFGFGYVITATFLVAIVRASEALQAAEPLVWVLVGIAAMPSVALWGAVAARIGVRRAYAAAALTQATGVLASVLWHGVAGAIVAAVLLGGTIMGLTALGLMAARQQAAGNVARALAIMTAAFGVGQIVGPAFAGLVHDRTGSFLMPSLAAAGALVVAALLAVRGDRGGA